jgi:ribose transport system permease protein
MNRALLGQRSSRTNDVGGSTRSSTAVDHFTGGDRGIGPNVRRLAARSWIYWVLVALIIFFTIKNGAFLSQANWLNTTNTAVTVICLATAQTLIITAGGIDLSQGAVVGLSGVAGAWVMEHWLNGGSAHINGPLVAAAGFGVAVLIGLLVGTVNALVISRWNIGPFVVTLATLGICTGTANLLSDGQGISNIPQTLTTIGSYNLAGWLPVPVLAAVAIATVAGVALTRTRFGVYTFSIGDSEQAAERAGISVARHRFKLYVISGVVASIAGFLLVCRLGNANPASGASTDLLNAIAAVVLGGASLSGGRGSIGRTMAGVGIISVLLTGLVIINLQVFWQQIVVGVVLVVAVYIDQRGSQR